MGYFMNGMIMVLNAGSSSLKFAAYEAAGAALAQLHAGQVEGIGATPHFVARDSHGLKIADELWPDGGAPADHAAALNVIITWLEDRLPAPVVAIGHRVVHGGPDFSAPILIDLGVMAELQALVPLAPLHQPHNLAGITAAAKRFRGVPQVACFDTAFHRTQPFVADTYGLPPQYHAQGIRRFGFQGLSYE
jgi:acetate kinase